MFAHAASFSHELHRFVTALDLQHTDPTMHRFVTTLVLQHTDPTIHRFVTATIRHHTAKFAAVLLYCIILKYDFHVNFFHVKPYLPLKPSILYPNNYPVRRTARWAVRWAVPPHCSISRQICSYTHLPPVRRAFICAVRCPVRRVISCLETRMYILCARLFCNIKFILNIQHTFDWKHGLWYNFS